MEIKIAKKEVSRGIENNYSIIDNVSEIHNKIICEAVKVHKTKICKKKSFQTKFGAQLVIANPKRSECRVYWCSECKAYHTTSKPYKRWRQE